MDVHFVDVGMGNMTILVLPEGSVFVVDCNITDTNQERVLRYVRNAVGADTRIDVFIASHRDADHIRGIRTLHARHPIRAIWDPGVPSGDTGCEEYRAYMDLRRSVANKTIEARKRWTYGDATLRCMNAAWEDITEPNDQSVVLKVEYGDSSAMLAGDTGYRPWRDKILPWYADEKLSSSVLLASHHGSLSFFRDSGEEQNYTRHLTRVSPSMTIISVGPNIHGLPNQEAVRLYTQHSSGSNKGNRVYTTEDQGSMRLVLKAEGGWSLSTEK